MPAVPAESGEVVTAAAYDPSAVRQWLATLHGNSQGWAWIGSTHDRFRGRAYDTTDPAWIDTAARYVDQLDAAGAAGIYLRTTTLTHRPTEGRGGDTASHALPGLAADLDIAGPGHKTGRLRLPLPPNAAAAVAIVDEAGLPDPSYWVHSGGGLYPWWILDRPHHITDPQRAARFTTRWQDVIRAAAGRLGWHYGPIGDLSRILRIPGTVNRKAGMDAPALCRIVRDTGRRYTLANLHGAVQDAEAAMPAQPKPQVRTIVPRATGGDLKPWDDYEARTDWAAILEPHGWTLSHEQGRVRYWCRPGKRRGEGHSASTGKDPARDRLWCFTDATEFEPNRTYTKFEAYALLETRGDHKAAGRELAKAGYGSQQEKTQVAA